MAHTYPQLAPGASLSPPPLGPTMPTMHPTVIVDSLEESAALLRRRAVGAADLARSVKPTRSFGLADLGPESVVRVAASDERSCASAQNAPSHVNGPGGTPPSQRGTDHAETTTATPRRRRQQRPSRCDRPYQLTPSGRHTCSRTIAVWWIAAVAVVVALLLHVAATRDASLNGAALFKLTSSCHKTNGTGTACHPASEPFGGEKEYTQKGSPRGEEGCIDGT